MAMALQQRRNTRPPLTAAKLEELALSYVGRFATSRAKLRAYLQRKLRERGWDSDGEPPIEMLADKFVRLGYVDDHAFALSKARSLTGRGYGARRVDQALAMAGIDEEKGADARTFAEEEAVNAALRFAKRRALGPYAHEPQDPSKRERALAAMVRAGHRFPVAKAIIDLKPGENPDAEALSNLS
ncbi:MAG TPA: RecX family transcriptional regulator [Sphingomicrobium sp.]